MAVRHITSCLWTVVSASLSVTVFKTLTTCTTFELRQFLCMLPLAVAETCSAVFWPFFVARVRQWWHMYAYFKSSFCDLETFRLLFY